LTDTASADTPALAASAISWPPEAAMPLLSFDYFSASHAIIFTNIFIARLSLSFQRYCHFSLPLIAG